MHVELQVWWMFVIKDNETRRTRALKKAKDTQEMCKVRDKEIERQVTEIALNSICLKVVFDMEVFSLDPIPDLCANFVAIRLRDAEIHCLEI